MGLPPPPIIVTVAAKDGIKGEIKVAISSKNVEMICCRDQVCRILTELEKHIVGVHFSIGHTELKCRLFTISLTSIKNC